LAGGVVARIHHLGSPRTSLGGSGYVMRRGGRAGAGVAMLVLAALASCGTNEVIPLANGETPAVDAAARIGVLRARFALPPSPTTFERSGADDLRAVFPESMTRGLARAASVALPVRADGESHVEDVRSHVSVRFRLRETSASAVSFAEGYALYSGALRGADVIHRVHAEGTEDFVVFETRPAQEELRYDVDVSRTPGLRLVSNTLEFLDEQGTPCLRVAPPYVVDARGARHEAKLSVSGCQVDSRARAPWGREVTPPGADRCTVHVTWRSITYPALVDPAWVATGSMATLRSTHTSNVLASGIVLVAGGKVTFNGLSGGLLASAELFDPVSGSFAATGSLAATRTGHVSSALASGKVLIAGGYGDAVDGSAEIFDPALGTFSPTGSMTGGRSAASASALASGKVLVAGGYFDPAPLMTAEIFDPAGNGGVGSFTATGSMGTARLAHTATVLSSGKVLIAGGRDASQSLASAELFDPAAAAGAGAFASTGPMAAARSSHAVTALPSGRVLVAGGRGAAGAVLASAELFDPLAAGGAGAFAPTGPMLTARAEHTVSLLPSGKVLVAGGQTVLSLLSTELFDPTLAKGAGGFAPGGPLTATRHAHTADVLLTGQVVVIGGTRDISSLATAELFGGSRGDACTNGYCLSNLFCVDGFCCDTPCAAGSCDRCDVKGKEGTCSVAPAGNPGASPACTLPFACDGLNKACPTSCASDAACAPSFYCAPNGACVARKAQAATCNMQTDCKTPPCRVCDSNSCVDGLCCDTACSGTCESCVAALKQSGLDDGACGPIKDGSDPREGCAPSTQLCGADGACNGAGACRLFTPAGRACGSGLVCDGAGSCAPPAGATCDGDHIATSAEGAIQDCSPYKCESNGACKQRCGSVDDCAAPAACDPTGACVAEGGPGDSGCSASAQTPSGTAWLLGLLVTLLARGRRRPR